MYSIEVKGVSKKYRIYHDKSLTLKERILFFNRTKYDEHIVLDNVELNIEKGKTVGLIGQNGSGKSTLLKLITQIIYPDSGFITTSGKISSLLELGAGFHPDFSGRENIYTNASIFGLTKKQIDERFEQIVDFSEMQEFIDNPVRTYSSGMYMRLAFSVAVSVDPDILLIDEILAVGDTKFQKKCFDKILQFKEMCKTIIIVSHDNSSIKKLCDNVAWLENGIIRQYGQADYIIDQYLQYMHGKSQVKNDEVIVKKEDKSDIKKDNNENYHNIAIPEEVPRRWGNKSIEITKVMFLNRDLQETYNFSYGSSLAIEIYYKVNEDVEKPVFGMGIFLVDGTRCYGTNTNIEGIDFGTLNIGKEDKITFNIDSLDLVNGTYFFNFAVHAVDGYAYDYLNKMFKILIYSDKNDIGIFRPKHKWIVKGNRGV